MGAERGGFRNLSQVRRCARQVTFGRLAKCQMRAGDAIVPGELILIQKTPGITQA
jgi:hypothetical protein